MSVWIYRNGEKALIPPHRLNAHLEQGWGVTEDAEAKVPTFEEADTNGSGKLSVDEVRAAAKEAGIKGWHNKRIKTLKSELGYDEE